MRKSMQRRGIVALIVTLCGLGIGCAQDYAMDRPDFERGTLGEELHHIWLKDTTRSATNSDERTALLRQHEEEFIDGVDRAVPPGKVHELDEFLLALLPVIEDGTIPALTRRVPLFLEQAAADEELMASLEDPPIYRARDFLTPLERGRLVEELTDYEELPWFLGHVGSTFIAYDGFDEYGQWELGNPSGYSDFLRSLALAVEELPQKEATDRWATTLRDLLMVPDNRYRGGAPARNRFIALFDDRGLPVVRHDGNGQVRSPFVDQQGDGLADVDEAGRFILDNGQILAIPPFSTDEIDHPGLYRDVHGRVETSPNEFVFEYVDISSTAIPYLVRMAGELAAEDTLYYLSRVAREVLGPAVVAEDERGTYRSFPSDHPIVDTADAVVSGLSVSELPEVMDLTARYLNRNVDDLAFLAYAVGNAGDTFGQDPDIDVSPDQTLIFDLLEVLRELSADPELWADVMEAFRDPIVARGGEAMATLVKYRDLESVPEENGPYDACFQQCKGAHQIGTEERFDCIRDCPMDEIFSDPMDFDQPESKQNRSRHQRLFHLLRDTAGAPYALELQELEVPDFNIDPEGIPPLVSLPGAAEAFVRSIAGMLHLADYIPDETENEIGVLINLLGAATGGVINPDTVAELLSTASALFGAQLDVEPTPDQITRLFNQPDLRFEEDGVVIDVKNPVCNDGFEMAHHHADGLYASEASGLIDVIHPLAKAFAKHEREELFTSLFIIVHQHYSGHDDLYRDVDGNPSPMKGSNLVSAERAMQQVFEDGEIFAALRALALSTETLTDDDGVALDERLRQLVHKWVRNDEGYAPRSAPYVIVLPDGRQLESASRLEVIIDRVNEMIDRAEEDQQVRQYLKAGTSGFFDVVLSAEHLGFGQYQFQEEGVVALISHWLSYLGARAKELEERGEFDTWLTEDVPEAAMKFYSSRAFFAFVELLDALHGDAQGQRLMKGLPAHVVEDGQRIDRLAMMFYGLIVQLFDLEHLMPAGRFIMGVLDPDRRETIEPHAGLPNGTLLMHLLARIPEVDEEGVGIDILARGSRTGHSYDPTWTVLTELILRYFSSEPMAQGAMSGQARQVALEEIGEWIYDGRNGLERFYEIVEMRGNMELEELPEPAPEE